MTRSNPSESRPAALALAIVFAVCASWGCSGGQAKGLDASATNVGAILDFNAVGLDDDKAFSLRSLRGKVVVVDVWASWCKPCEEALKAWGSMAAENSTRGLIVVALGVDEDRGAGQRHAKGFSRELLWLWDRDQKVVSKLKVAKMPTTYVVDRTGKVTEVLGGFEAGHVAKIKAAVAAALAK